MMSPLTSRILERAHDLTESERQRFACLTTPPVTVFAARHVMDQPDYKRHQHYEACKHSANRVCNALARTGALVKVRRGWFRVPTPNELLTGTELGVRT